MNTFSQLSVSQVFKSNPSSKKCWNSHNIISRSTTSIKFNDNPIKDSINISVSKPISDFPIIKNLNIFQFTHPQLLINFLSMHRPSSKTKIKDILYPYLLFPDFSIDNIICSLANSMSLTTSRLLQNFTSNLDCKKAKEEWEKRFKGIPIDTNLKITEQWQLNTLNDLESLHLLACSINCQIYLLFNLTSPTNEDESTLFTTIIGPTNDISFCSFFLCESPTKIIYAKPLNFSKQNANFHHNFQLLKRVTLPSKKYAIYLNFPQLLKEINSKGSSFDSISAHFLIDPTVSEPVLSFSCTDKLKIEIRHPNDDYSYSELLEKLEHTTSSFTITEPAIMDDRSLLNFDLSSNKKVKVHSNSLITVHSIKESRIELDKIREIKNISQIEKLAFSFCSLNFPPLTKSSDFKLFQLIRFFAPFITKYKSFQTSKIESSPIITTHTDDFSLSNASNHPYAHLLCLYSIFNAASKSQTIFCKKCQKSRNDDGQSELVLVPVRSVSNECLISPFLTWICTDCFKRLTKREKFTIKGQFPMFHEAVDIDGTTRLQSQHNMNLALQSETERIHMSIMSVRSQPIGSLRALVPRIDHAFDEMVKIQRLFRQRMIRMKNVTAQDLATVRDSDEYNARIGSSQRAVPLREPDIEVVDYKMFELYLAGFTEKAAGTTEYLLTQPESSIKQDLIEDVTQSMQELYTTISSKIESIELKYSKQQQNSSEDPCSHDDSGRTAFNEELDKGSLLFNAAVKCEGDDVKCEPIRTNVYEVHLIENGNFITSSPLVTLKTRKLIRGVSLHNASQLIVVANDRDRLTTELHCVPLTNCNLDVLSTSSSSQSSCGEGEDKDELVPHSPDIVIENVSNCETAFSYDGLSVAVLGLGADENPLYIVTRNDEEGSWQAEYFGSFPATKVTWLPGSDSALLAANDDSYYVMRFGASEEEEDSAPVVDMPKHTGCLVKLLSSFGSVWAVFDSGDCVALNLDCSLSEEEEEEASEIGSDGDVTNRIAFKVEGKIVDGYLTSDNGEIGVTVIDENGNLHFKSSSYFVRNTSPSVKVQPSFSHQPYNFPSGIVNDFEKLSGHFTYNQIALSFAEMFPVLVGYFFRSTFFLIQNTFKSYHPQNKNRFLISSIRSFYVNEMMHTSLHHIEDSLFQMQNMKAKVVTFIDFGLQNCSSFIDSVFGTSFAFCECDGVWTGIKATNDFVYVIVYIKALSSDARSQILYDSTISSFLCQKEIYFLTESEVALFDILSNIDFHNVLQSKNYHAYALVFLRNSSQRIFEYKTIESSLNNVIQNATIEVVGCELFDDYSEVLINPSDGSEFDIEERDFNHDDFCSLKSNWMKMLEKIDLVDVGDAVYSIKKMIALMSTLYQFQDIEPLSVISNCF